MEKNSSLLSRLNGLPLGKSLLCFSIFILLSLQAQALVIYVNDGSTVGDVYTSAVGNNGNPGTAALPLASLKFALSNFAFGPGDSIYIDAGTYADQMIDIGSADAGLVVKGAGRNSTIFDGINRTSRWMVISGNDVQIIAMTVRRYGHPTGLAGQALTLQDATGMLVSDILFDDQGTSGGEANIYIATTTTISTTATITNCVIQNTNGNFGGGIDVCANTISAVPSLTVTLNDCVIENCGKNNFNGGALLLYKGLSAGATTQAPVVTATNCVFGSPGRGNVALRGGGIYVTDAAELTLNGACVADNQAIDVAGPDGGGGIYLLDGTVNLVDGMVTNNSANTGTPKYGGGIFVNKLFSGTSNLNVYRTVISGNLGLDGAGIYLDRSTTNLANCLMYDNQASDEGGAILLNDANASLTMYNCTVTENTTTSASSSRHGGLQNKQCLAATAKNCIFWNNTRADIADLGTGNVTVNFSIVDAVGGPTFTDAGGNSTADPAFMNPALDDFRLSVGSPAINTGNLDAFTPPDDLVFTLRDPLPDMGSYEFGAASLLTRDCPSIRQLILPIENVAFSVECQGEGRVFQLKNESQTTLRSFWVEGSLDGETFSAISERLSFEENTSTLEIALPAIAQQQQYFRLAKQDENTSDLAYSQIRQQLPCENAGMQVSLYPSLVADWLIFRISGTESLAFNVTVVDLAGKVLLQMKADAQGEMDLRNLPSGVYLLRVDDWAGNAEVVRFMKM